MQKKKKAEKPDRFRFFKNFWFLLKETFKAFSADNVIKLSASLSYYTIFSLPPLLIIIITLCGAFFGPEAVRGEIFGQINGLVGNDAALQIQESIKNIKLAKDSTFATIVGIVFLLLSASGVFTEIQDTMNYVWGLKAKPKRGWVKLIKNRLASFSMLGAMSFLLLVGLVVNSFVEILSKRLQAIFPDDFVSLFYILNIFIVFAIITLLFTIIFRTLPDGRVALRDAIVGASFTAILFMGGKLLIGLYLGNSSVATAYGTAASVIVVLVWVYYSAIILYFGAEFTKEYAFHFGKKIVPKDYAIQIRKELQEKKSTKKLAPG